MSLLAQLEQSMMGSNCRNPVWDRSWTPESVHSFPVPQKLERPIRIVELDSLQSNEWVTFTPTPLRKAVLSARSSIRSGFSILRGTL